MTGWRLHGAVVAGVLLSLWLGACERCAMGEKPAIATLSTVVGSGVARDYAASPHTWLPAEVGAELALGDGARTDTRSTAELTFKNGATLALEPNTTIRLLADHGDAETGIDVQAGQAQLRSRGSALQLRTHLGLATIAPESEITLRRDGAELGLSVAFGAVTFQNPNAEEVGLVAGDDVRIGIGMAVFGLERGKDAAQPTSQDIVVEVERGSARASGAGGTALRTLKQGSHPVTPGTQLRLSAGDEVVVRRGAQRARLRGAGDFVLGVEGALAESRRGRISFDAIEADVEIRVPGGVIIARVTPEGTRAELSVGPNESELKVERGRVSANVHGEEVELSEGLEHHWRNSATTAAGVEAGPTYHNMAAPAGRSFIVHAPKAPVAVGFSFENKCPHEGLLEQVGSRQAARGVGSANLAFGPGVRAYTLRCLGKNGKPGRIVARGSVQVMIDSGTRRLPARAPRSRVEADGRTYTIYFQNQLPEVLVRWPNPPSASSFLLQVDDKPIELSAPEHVFRSGDLGIGKHRLSFQAGSRRSRTTTVDVRFDNAAPKASLSAPEDRGFKAGDLVTVEGVALPTWKVTLEGGTIAMQPGERFTGQVQTSAAQPDISVRLSHPRLGTHYYLRRASGSP